MIKVIFEGLLLGLSSGAYCLSACLVFFMPYLLSQARQKTKENLIYVLVFMLGRLIAYIGFALCVGFLSTRYRNVFTAKLSNISLIAVSGLMITYALMRNFPDAKLCQKLFSRFDAVNFPFLLGIFTGLNPCMPFLAGALRIWTLGNILMGVVLFLAFFLGTAVYMLPLVFVSYLNRIERLKHIGTMVALLCGLWFLFIGISGIIKLH